ncbi:AarF domain containing kinase [Seminavis robusta]|uniref:AarF domain containing kinase n=1 Tax=Seminavis robusta TaxID=568900 RepID=A0A9N8HKB8_9STRA|nr:AarF domain containing kinase [Seminavis robusta]|eukprot:Sro825_g207640.1 AarF domain containing kinase (459) ;mRNA; f:9791-11167
MEDAQNATRPRRGPPFPPEAYHLLQEEEEQKHIFLSFIDHLDEPYTQIASLTEPRAYARADQFENEGSKNTVKIQESPTIDDVACPPSRYGPVGTFFSWSGLPARVVVGALAYFAFPVIIDILETFAAVDYTQDTVVDLSFLQRIRFIYPTTYMDIGAEPASKIVEVTITEEERKNLASLVNLYIPGISIVLGTYISMTLNILYERMRRLQLTITEEASMLAFCFQVLLDLFSRDRNNLIPSTQSIADQIHVLLRESRGKETMRIIYNDPLANILRIVQRYSRKPNSCTGNDATLVGVVRDCIRQLYELRSRRMNDEALFLAPTHYDVMTFLSILLLVGVALGTVATAQTNGVPTELSRILFAILVVCYTTIYEMSYDLNRPFDGSYQLRRSGAAMHFLQIKNMVANHPVLRREITFSPDIDETLLDADNKEISETIVNGESRKAASYERRKRDIWYN